jgi:hypothetical protein
MQEPNIDFPVFSALFWYICVYIIIVMYETCEAHVPQTVKLEVITFHWKLCLYIPGEKKSKKKKKHFLFVYSY